MGPFSWIRCPDPRLADAVAYLAKHPGKQLRSRLTLLCAELVAGESLESAVAAGEAIELLHTYSLVHDDLPAMDDDDLRRGHPTLHCAFDEATAILTGDGLQAAAFEHLATIESLSDKQRIDLIKVVSHAVGFNGMVGGQALDLAAEHQSLDDSPAKDGCTHRGIRRGRRDLCRRLNSRARSPCSICHSNRLGFSGHR